MKKFLSQLKKPAVRAVQLILIFGIAFLVLLYFMGAYDLSFLDRYKLLDDGRTNSAGGNMFSDALHDLIDEGEDVTVPAETDEAGETIPENSAEPAVSYRTSAAKALAETQLEDKPAAIPSLETLAESGYTAADDTYDYIPGESALGRMTFSYQLPETYSLRKRLTTRNTVIYPSDDSEKYIETKQFREERPAIELYMGYILMDDGSDVFLISSDGTPLCRYDAKRYEPAYVRDSEDRPLFMRENNGTTAYFYLSEDGSQFMISDYDPKKDGRGLSFDYPSDYGKSDATNIITTYSRELDRFGYLTADENGNSTGVLASYKYTSALPFTNGLGAVTTTDNRGGMFFLNEHGREAFDACFMYLSEHNRYTIENLMPPLTDGIESIGFYYFDHGFTRVRRQKIDNWNWVMRGLVRVVSDVDCLIRPDGSEYELPLGYTLEGYSDGCILLSKNGAFGFMDYTGAWIAQPIYTDAIPFVNGLAALKTADGRWGMIDTLGNIVLPFTYDSVSQVSGGLVAAYREENGWTVFRLMQPPVQEEPAHETDEAVSEIIEAPAAQE